MPLPRANQETPPTGLPQTTPDHGVGYGHPEYHFVEAVMQLQTTLHQMNADHKVSTAKLESKIDHLTGAVDSTKTKVDDLVRWKTLILGGAAVLGFVMAGVFSLYIKFGDRISVAPAPMQGTPTTQSSPN